MPEHKSGGEIMNATYSTMFYNGRHLIIKTVEGNEPFVVAETYLATVAELICSVLAGHADDELNAN